MKSFKTGCITLLAGLMLTACGGGGGSGTTSSGTPTVTTPSTPDPSKQVSLSLGSVDTSKISGLPALEISTSRQAAAFSSGSISSSPNDFIIVRSGTIPVLIAPTFDGETSVTVDYASTALSLVLLQPALLGASVDTQKALVAPIKASPAFPTLVSLLQTRINSGVEDPLNSLVFPEIASLASQIIDGLPQQTPLVSKVTAKQVGAVTGTSARNAFTAAVDIANPELLSINNPNATYYDVTINNRTKPLTAKEGMFSVNYTAFPLMINTVSDSLTSFLVVTDFAQKTDAKYSVDISCKFSLDPSNTTGKPGGDASWRNIIKGISILFETAGVPFDHTNTAKFANFTNTYQAAMSSLGDKLAVMTQNADSAYYQARKIAALTQVMTIVINNLPLNPTLTNDDKAAVFRTMSTLNDLIADVSAVAGTPTAGEVQTAIDLFNNTNSSQNIHEMIRKIRDGRMGSASVWRTIKQLVNQMVLDTYLVFLSKPLPDGFDVRGQLLKITATMNLLAQETNIPAGMTPLVGLFKEFANPANGLVDSHLNALFGLMSQNALTGGYRATTVGNKMTPFAYDVANCFGDDSSVKLLMSAGRPVPVSKPVVKEFKLLDSATGTVLYDLKAGKVAPVALPSGSRIDAYAELYVKDSQAHVPLKLVAGASGSEKVTLYKAQMFFNSRTASSMKVLDQINAYRQLTTGSILWEKVTHDFGTWKTSPFSSSTYAADQFIFSRNAITINEDVTNLRFRFYNAEGQYETIVVPNSSNTAPTVSLRAVRSLSDPSKYDFSVTASDDRDPTLNLTVNWAFGDGTTQVGGFTTTHQYPATQDYTATVTLTDSSGASTAVTATVSPTINKANFVDVVFLVDLTGSYSDDLDTFKTQANAIVKGISSLGNNVQIGLASFADFPVSPFGGGSDFSYKLNHELTYLTSYIPPALNALTLYGGADLPEADLEALYQLATTDIGWVASSKKVVLLATDAPFHNSDIEPTYPGHGYTATLAALKARGIAVYGLVPDGQSIADVDKIAADTGGQVFTLGAGSSGIVDAIKGISTGKSVARTLRVPNSYVVGTRKTGQPNR